MGVRNLWDILDSCKKILPLHHLQNKRVCIDLSCWIVQLQNVNKTHCAKRDKLYLTGLFHRLRALIALNCSIVLVTDGSIPSIKMSTYRQRLNMGNEAPLQEKDLNKLTSVRRNMGSEFSCMIKEAKLLAKALGIPCLDGIEEAEAQCAVLNSESLCDACFTSDSDAFLFGAKTVYRDICLGDGGHVVCYEITDIERNLGFGRNSLVTLGVLLGSDYSSGVHGLGPESACLLVKSAGDSDVLQRLVSEGLSFAKKPKVSKRKGQNITQNEEKDGMACNLQSGAQFLQVINAFLKPKVHSPNSDAVQRVLGTYPFDRFQLQEKCTKFFDWSPEKTDEYILPKIAERDLRRYDNLRSTSSQVGLKLSIDQMPVKCPVSSIVKERKHIGRDYYEVSWEEMHGLHASAVPADLVQSACPEKIIEFNERRAQKKKTKQCRAKPKKPERKTSMSEVELRLQELLVDIDREAAPIRAANLYGGSGLEMATHVDSWTQGHLLQDESHSKSKDIHVLDCSPTLRKANRMAHVDSRTQGYLLQDESYSKSKDIHVLDCSPTGSQLKKANRVTLFDTTNQELLLQDKPRTKQRMLHAPDHNLSASYLPDADIIDLVSPSPALHARSVSKCQGAGIQHIDIIELFESENESSPDHLRRGKELRSFIATVRHD